MKPFLSPEDDRRLIAAIQAAEALTSGEIVVNIQPKITGDIERAAQSFFIKKQLDRTRERNAVLIMLVVKDRQVAVIGDSGIHAKVPKDFWSTVVAAIVTKFGSGDYIGGLEAGISEVGRQLQEYFPRRQDDVNELADEVQD